MSKLRRIYEMFDPMLDFSDMKYAELTVPAGTKTYSMLDSMEEEAWTDYLDSMAKSGITVEYDLVENKFVVKNGQGQGEGTVNEASWVPPTPTKSYKQEVIDSFAEFKTQNPNATYDELVVMVQNKTGVTPSTIYRLLAAAVTESAEPDSRAEMEGKIKSHYNDSDFAGKNQTWMAKVNDAFASLTGVSDDERTDKTKLMSRLSNEQIASLYKSLLDSGASISENTKPVNELESADEIPYMVTQSYKEGNSWEKAIEIVAKATGKTEEEVKEIVGAQESSENLLIPEAKAFMESFKAKSKAKLIKESEEPCELPCHWSKLVTNADIFNPEDIESVKKHGGSPIPKAPYKINDEGMVSKGS